MRKRIKKICTGGIAIMGLFAFIGCVNQADAVLYIFILMVLLWRIFIGKIPL